VGRADDTMWARAGNSGQSRRNCLHMHKWRTISLPDDLTTSKLAWNHPLFLKFAFIPQWIHLHDILIRRRPLFLTPLLFDGTPLRQARLIHFRRYGARSPNRISAANPALTDYEVYRNVNIHHFLFPPSHRQPLLTPLWYITPTTRSRWHTRSLWSVMLVIGRRFIQQVSPTRLCPHQLHISHC